MVNAFQVILLFVIIVSFFTVFGYQEDKETQSKVLAMFLASLVAYIVSVLWL